MPVQHSFCLQTVSKEGSGPFYSEVVLILGRLLCVNFLCKRVRTWPVLIVPRKQCLPFLLPRTQSSSCTVLLFCIWKMCFLFDFINLLSLLSSLANPVQIKELHRRDWGKVICQFELVFLPVIGVFSVTYFISHQEVWISGLTVRSPLCGCGY